MWNYDYTTNEFYYTSPQYTRKKDAENSKEWRTQEHAPTLYKILERLEEKGWDKFI